LEKPERFAVVGKPEANGSYTKRIEQRMCQQPSGVVIGETRRIAARSEFAAYPAIDCRTAILSGATGEQ